MCVGRETVQSELATCHRGETVQAAPGSGKPKSSSDQQLPSELRWVISWAFP